MLDFIVLDFQQLSYILEILLINNGDHLLIILVLPLLKKHVANIEHNREHPVYAIGLFGNQINAKLFFYFQKLLRV